MLIFHFGPHSFDPGQATPRNHSNASVKASQPSFEAKVERGRFGRFPICSSPKVTPGIRLSRSAISNRTALTHGTVRVAHVPYDDPSSIAVLSEDVHPIP